jgi:hypothetical protein
MLDMVDWSLTGEFAGFWLEIKWPGVAISSLGYEASD